MVDTLPVRSVSLVLTFSRIYDGRQPHVPAQPKWFTSMLPTTAQLPRILGHDRLLEEYYGCGGTESWKVRDDGSLYLPPSVRFQRIPPSRGDPAAAGTISFYFHQDMADRTVPLVAAAEVIFKTLMEVEFMMLPQGQKERGPYEIELLPLAIQKNAMELMAQEARLGSDIQHKGPSEVQTEGHPLVVGIILVHAESIPLLSKDSLTTWSKFGVYTASSFAFEPARWEHGILVSDHAQTLPGDR